MPSAEITGAATYAIELSALAPPSPTPSSPSPPSLPPSLPPSTPPALPPSTTPLSPPLPLPEPVSSPTPPASPGAAPQPGTTDPTTITISGHAYDGYLTECTVYLDVDGDWQLGPGDVANTTTYRPLVSCQPLYRTCTLSSDAPLCME